MSPLNQNLEIFPGRQIATLTGDLVAYCNCELERMRKFLEIFRRRLKREFCCVHSRADHVKGLVACKAMLAQWTKCSELRKANRYAASAKLSKRTSP